MVSFIEARKLSFGTLQNICKLLHGRETESTINILEIKPGGHEGGLDSYGVEVKNQIAEILNEYGFIRFLDGNTEVEITVKGVEEVVRKILLQR